MRSRDLDGFELVGEDGVFYPAKAVVLRGGGIDYQPVPGDVQEKLLKAYLEEEKEDEVIVQ